MIGQGQTDHSKKKMLIAIIFDSTKNFRICMLLNLKFAVIYRLQTTLQARMKTPCKEKKELF